MISRDEAELWPRVTVTTSISFFLRGPVMIDTQKTSDAERYCDTAEVIREVARRAHLPEIRDELFVLADRYDRLAEHVARRESAAQAAPTRTRTW